MSTNDKATTPLNRSARRSRHGWVWPDREELKPLAGADGEPYRLDVASIGRMTRQQRRWQQRKGVGKLGGQS